MDIITEINELKTAIDENGRLLNNIASLLKPNKVRLSEIRKAYNLHHETAKKRFDAFLDGGVYYVNLSFEQYLDFKNQPNNE